MLADLHLHTTASDGQLNPSQVVEAAHKNGLKVIAVTDHDTFDGITEALTWAKKYSLEIIPAVELSSNSDGHDIHILAYWPDYKAKWLNEVLKRFRKGRKKRARLMVEKLRNRNIDITFEDVIDIAGKAALGRSHVARVLLKKGYVKSIQEAFIKYIGHDACCYVEKQSKSPKEVLQIIKEAGGIAVLAHPGIACSEELIGECAKDGLVGLEVYHPNHSQKQIRFLESLAKENGLIATGGSDFHARSSSRGAVIGTCRTSLTVVNQLKELAQSATNR